MAECGGEGFAKTLGVTKRDRLALEYSAICGQVGARTGGALMVDGDKGEGKHLPRRGLLAGGAVAAAAGIAAIVVPPEQAIAWAKPTIRAAIGVP